MLSIENDVDFAILSPNDDSPVAAFSLVLPILSHHALPIDSWGRQAVTLPVDENDLVLRWLGADGAVYRVDLKRVGISDLLQGDAIETVDLFCTVVNAATGEVLGLGEIVFSS